MRRFSGQVSAILWKDILSEMRTRELLGGMIIFSLLALLIFSFAFDLRVEDATTVAPGILWVAFVFSGMLGLGRSFVLERASGAMDGLLSAPIERGAIYLAKFLGNFAFMCVVEAVTIPVFTSFFNVAVGTPEVIGIALLGTAGFAAIGTLFSAMAANTRAREVLLPLMMFPIAIPVIIASVRATALALDQSPLRDRIGWIELLAAFDILFAVLCYALFEYVVEE